MNKTFRPNLLVFASVIIFFAIFLGYPLYRLLALAITSDHGIDFTNLIEIFTSTQLREAFLGSFHISIVASILATIIGFVFAYTVNFTNVSSKYKRFIEIIVNIPMLTPTIVYGFILIFTFGRQGFLTRILGFQLFDIYSFTGLLVGFLIYTVPISFMLINNSMKYIDSKFFIVSELMGDSKLKQLKNTLFMPLLTTLGISLVQTFFLSFTDFGLPASIAGNRPLIATTLFNQMMGAIPDFNRGAIIAIAMLLPAIISVSLMLYLKKYDVKYDNISRVQPKKSSSRDLFFFIATAIPTLFVVLTFFSILVVVFTNSYPFDLGFTTQHFIHTLINDDNSRVYFTALELAFLSAIFGIILSFSAALLVRRTGLNKNLAAIIDAFSHITNAIPGMVMGVSFMFAFLGTTIQNTMTILVLCNVVYFFSTPFNMATQTLEKLPAHYERTATLLGDNYFKSLFKVIIPNCKKTLVEMFSYIFIHAMTTISALIFLVGVNTQTITTRIVELQNFNRFTEIFVLAILLIVTNLVVKNVLGFIANSGVSVDGVSERLASFKIFSKVRRKHVLRVVGAVAAVLIGFGLFNHFHQGEVSDIQNNLNDPVIIFSNADQEAIEIMQNVLNERGLQGQYIIQVFGTSELSGRVASEGTNIEADVITLSSFFIESNKEVFQPFNVKPGSLYIESDFYSPIIALEGSLIVNTMVLENAGLPTPTSLADLANPIYAGYLSIPDLHSSSTGWLLVQAIIDNYSTDQAKEILNGIIRNAGNHLESSGSTPIVKARAGEVAIAFGLRHQGVRDQEAGLPIQVIDVVEGNYFLTEAVALVNHTNSPRSERAREIAEILANDTRPQLLNYYQTALFEDEYISDADRARINQFPEVLSEELLLEHQEFFRQARALN